MGTLKTTPQQEVETRTTSSGQQVIVIEPANPQVVYVPQYDSQVVYTQPATSSTVVIQKEDDDDAEAAVAGLIGFTAGVAIGAAMDNNYYYGPYGWHGGAYMYNDAWDDWYDDREDAREDWYDSREDAREDYQDRREDLADERGERAGTQQEQRTERQQNRQNNPEAQAQREQRRSDAQTARRGVERGRCDLRVPRQRPGGTRERRAKRHPLRRVLRVFERTIGACGQLPRATEQGQRARRRSTPMTDSWFCARRLGAVALTCATLAWSPSSAAADRRATADVRDAGGGGAALITAVKAGSLDDILAVFGPGGKDLVDSSDPATGRHNREVFTVAVAEGWRLVDQGPTRKVLVIGHEGWPFPVPLMRDGNRWRFDNVAGKEEILARRIGRNELAAIRICRTYVAAQQQYAAQPHDGKSAGLYARKFRSDPGQQNGLYWPTARGQTRSPLGDLVAQAAQEGRPLDGDRQAPRRFTATTSRS